MQAARNRRLRFGDYELDALAGKLLRGGRPVKIEPQPLRVLLERPGEVVSREQLRARVWGDSTFVEFDQSLNYCVRQIRLALRDRASRPSYIETRPKQGYRFIGVVEQGESPDGLSPEMVAVQPEPPSETSPSVEIPGRANAARWRIGFAAAGLLLAVVVSLMLTRDRAVAPGTALHLAILPPAETSFVYDRNGEGGFSLSPDGSMLAFVGRTQGKAQLWIRRFDQAEPRLVPGSEGAYKPFWSPDSRWVAFFTPLKLKKIEVANGATKDLCDVPPNTGGGTWSPRGVILWAQVMGKQPMQQIPDIGGSPVAVAGTNGGIQPQFLPDGRRFFYKGGLWSQDLWLASLDRSEPPRRIGETGMQPTYSAGHLLWVSNGRLTARRFDPSRGQFTGRPFPLNAPVATRVHLGLQLADFSANPGGMLVYTPRSNSLTELRWRDRGGKLLGTLGPPGEYYTPRISPDGKRVAFTRRDGNNSEIWIADIATNTQARLTFDPGIDEYPVWSPDGKAITFANDASGFANLYRKSSTGTGAVERLTTSKVIQQPLDWSSDGRFLLFTQITYSSEIMIQRAGGGEPVSYLTRGFGAAKAQFNPGAPQWIAYDNDDSGRREIYVQGFEPGKAASTARWQISMNGGTGPRWRGDGREIFYLGLDGKMMAARISGEGTSFHAATPERLFNATPPLLRSPAFEYDVAPDGQRFLMIEPAEKPEYLPLTVISNWSTK